MHNFLMAHRSRNDSYNYCPFNYVDQEVDGKLKAGEWRKNTDDGGMRPTGRSGSNNYSRTAKEIRGQFKDYFNSVEAASVCSLIWSIV